MKHNALLPELLSILAIGMIKAATALIGGAERLHKFIGKMEQAEREQRRRKRKRKTWEA
ncbi:TPA: hypothetical protein JG832_002522 [Enterobacter hormaechei subsp. xiangfangensis]|nr:hypothetical protein [Enterobacter hormaechei subsp. xiangfangensis]HAV1890657.1 hypothetical protein [Enterobacter hormaechei subsp. xiangfangensis]